MEKQIDKDLASRYPARILLAEDHPANRKLVLRMLKLLGYEAAAAANGREVLEALRAQPYDVLLMDIFMPELGGLDAMAGICAEWPPEERPVVIAMTANAMQGDRERYIRAGMDDYISKPVDLIEFQGLLHKWLSR